MKRSLGIILCFLLLSPFWLMHTGITFKRMQHRKAVKHELMTTLDHAQLVKISLSREEAQVELDWEHDKEFEYQGKMYDVIESYIVNGKHVYICWPDDDESALNRLLDSLTKQAEKSDSNKSKIKINILPFTVSTPAELRSTNSLIYHSTPFEYNFYYYNDSKAISPPPRG